MTVASQAPPGELTNHLGYGCSAADAPAAFVNEADLERLWSSPERYCLAVVNPAIPHPEKLAGRARLRRVAEAGGKSLFANLEEAPHAGVH